MKIPKDLRPHTIIWGLVKVLCDTVPVGRVEFEFEVAERAAQGSRAGALANVEQTYTRFKNAFISYSHHDLEKVLEKVQMLSALNYVVFMDKLILKPGEEWQEMLEHYIDRSDILYLFWSSAAKSSPMVTREWEYALKRNGGNRKARPVLQPIPLEGPPAVTPPAPRTPTLRRRLPLLHSGGGTGGRAAHSHDTVQPAGGSG